MKQNYNYITNLVFIFSLILLLVNDFFLKGIYHNWVTGKLSDVSGVIVFAFFFTAIRSDLKKYIFILTIILFALWKTEYSQFIIDFSNSISTIKIDRTIDYTDIFCSFVLIPLYWYSPKSIFVKPFLKKMIAYPIALSTFFAIVATSAIRPIPINTLYVDKYVKVKSSYEYFLNQLEKDSINYTIVDSIYVIKKDTLKMIVLDNIIILEDTIHSATIGILDKGKRIKIYIEYIVLCDNPICIALDPKAIKKFEKKYRIESKDYFKGFNE